METSLSVIAGDGRPDVRVEIPVHSWVEWDNEDPTGVAAAVAVVAAGSLALGTIAALLFT
jgi:hypothetical protein